MMKSARLLAVAAISVGLLAGPGVALAVNVSSNDGNGVQNRVGTATNGADVAGNLRSVRGQPVYYQGRVNFGFPCSMSGAERYTSDTASTSSVSRGGEIAAIRGIGCPNAPRVASRVARNVSLAPDPTGPFTASY